MVRLRRTPPDEPGWTRRRAGKGFVYLDGDGKRLADEAVERIKSLAIPPAWTDVWICTRDNGHLQAVGTDDAGRRQYLYHPDWRTNRDALKFERVVEMGKGLPRFRRRISKDLEQSGMPETRATALAVRLIDLGSFRIGSDVYADRHGTFGLTTLQRSHVRRHKGGLVFAFVGKSDVEHEIEIVDPVVLDAINELRRRRGGFDELLAFKEGRQWRRLTSDAVNDYLRDTSGLEVTAKDYRAWHATVLAALAIAEAEPASTKAARKRVQSAAIKEVAEYLGNTPTMARNSYIDPRVLDFCERGRIIDVPRAKDPDRRRAGAEKAWLKLLEG